jgi:hypothetical protein
MHRPGHFAADSPMSNSLLKDVCVRPVELADIAGFRACVDAVMREREYLAFLEAFPLEQTAAFVTTNIDNGNPHFVAAAGERIVG